MNSFTHPHFAEPGWLWLAIAGPAVFIGLVRYAALMRRRQLSRLAAPELLPGLTGTHSPMRRVIKHVLLAVAIGGIGLTLARPQWGVREDTVQRLGEDLVFVLDCSRSMLATDVSPNRLERAKLAMLSFIQRHTGGRVGLVAFSGQAFLQCPLTFDYGAFQEALRSIDEKTIAVPGTDIGRALDEASRAMEKNEREKRMILITDGEDLEKDGVRRAEALGKQGVVVFTVGVGTQAGSEIQFVNDQGKPEVLRDQQGEIVRSRLDETTLQEVARVTKANYFTLGPLGEGLEKVRLAIDKAQAGGTAGHGRKIGVDRFHVVLAIVIALIVVEGLIGTRRRRREQIVHGMGKPSGAIVPVVVLIAALGLHDAQGEAATETAPEHAPDTPREFYNAGTRALGAGQFRQAEAFLETALQSQSEPLQPLSLYNLGHVRFQQGLLELKKGPAATSSAGRAKRADDLGGRAVSAASEALESDDVARMVEAYMRGRGVKKELRAANTAVRKALEAFRATLNRWQRASGDFHSTAELNPADSSGKQNAEVVDRCIAKLVDSLKELEQIQASSAGTEQQLKEKLNQLKGRIPEADMPPGASGDDEEDEEPKGPQPGQEEGSAREDKEMTLSPEQAAWLLQSFRLDADRRLPMGQKDTRDPRNRSRKPW